MEIRVLGTSGLRVPVVGMGTWKTFDVHTAEAEAQCGAVVDAALETGITLFDSSPMYGEAERVLGEALEGRRDRALVATKVWTADDTDAEQQIRRSLDFYAGRVELYQVHNLVAWRTRLDQLERLREGRQVCAIGLTHYQHAAFPELLEAMRDPRVQAIQVPYNAVDQEVTKQVLPLAADLGLGVVVMRPLLQGTLGGVQPTAEELAPLAAFGVRSWSEALLKWLLSDPRVTTVIPATRNVEHARSNAAAGDPPWFGPEERDYVARLAARV